jgi:hypothetical protein
MRALFLKFGVEIKTRNSIIIGLILMLCSLLGFAKAEEPAKVQVGAYVLRINNVSQKDGTFNVDMWLWFRWKGADPKAYDTFEISNGHVDSRSTPVVSQDGEFSYTSVRVQGTVYHDFDVKRFPLDDHVITVELEDENLDTTKLEYVVDDGIALDPHLSVAGWDVKLQPATVNAHEYTTNYGLRSAGAASSNYSRFVLPVSLARDGYGPLLKQFWIAALSVLLGLLAFRIKATDLDARFGLGVGSIFAASANAFVVTDSLPKTTIVTLAEQINFLAIGAIFLCVFMSIRSLRMCYAGKEEQSEKSDRLWMVVIGVGYILANVFVVLFRIN